MALQLSLFFTVLIFVRLLLDQTWLVSGEPQVPCYFIFGDSLVDSGNNNILKTSAKVNYPPYGIDFPKGATGRFTNGRTAPDIIGQFLGFDNFIPPYANVTDQEISTGVNYGSGGAGIREESGRHVGDRYSLPSNDYVSNYFIPTIYNTSKIYIVDKFAVVLAEQYHVPTPNIACCQVKYGQCVPNSIPCHVRALSIFYDDYHPTEVVNTVIATRSYVALSDMDASPYDISHLARL
ncbi:hypothetical protein L1887_34393 [Cichorium endivia]|nr:hypothetical protein L1887_34393 [Cichorium endivia]